MINNLILNILQVDATTLVSANLLDSQGAGVRVYHDRIWQGHNYPATVFKVLSEVPQYRKGGMCLHDIEVSFIVYHTKDTEANTIATNLITLIEGYEGTYSGQVWKYTTLERRVQGYDDELQLHAVTVDFQFSRDN